jgi:hypothetical protein
MKKYLITIIKISIIIIFVFLIILTKILLEEFAQIKFGFLGIVLNLAFSYYAIKHIWQFKPKTKEERYLENKISNLEQIRKNGLKIWWTNLKKQNKLDYMVIALFIITFIFIGYLINQ